MKGRTYIIAALLALTSTGLRAQGDRGIITGTVKDASGAVIPGAQVTAVHLDTNTNFKAITSASGDFTVPDLLVGNYRVRVENSGFKTHVSDNVQVSPGATVRLDLAMEVGTSQQTVEVQSNALVLATDTARVSTEVSAKLVDDLPIIVNGAVRSPFDLAYTTPEAQGSGDSGLRIGGGRIGVYGMTLDGTAATVARPDAQTTWSAINSPSVEALTEFSVESVVSRPKPVTPPAVQSASSPNRAPTISMATHTSSCAIRILTPRAFSGRPSPFTSRMISASPQAGRFGSPNCTTAATGRSSSSRMRDSATASAHPPLPTLCRRPNSSRVTCTTG